MRKSIESFGQFEGLDADSSAKTKSPRKAKDIDGLMIHAGNLETRAGLINIEPGNSPFNSYYQKSLNFTNITHGALLQFTGVQLLVRHIWQ